MGFIPFEREKSTITGNRGCNVCGFAGGVSGASRVI